MGGVLFFLNDIPQKKTLDFFLFKKKNSYIIVKKYLGFIFLFLFNKTKKKQNHKSIWRLLFILKSIKEDTIINNKKKKEIKKLVLDSTFLKKTLFDFFKKNAMRIF